MVRGSVSIVTKRAGVHDGKLTAKHIIGSLSHPQAHVPCERPTSSTTAQDTRFWHRAFASVQETVHAKRRGERREQGEQLAFSTTYPVPHCERSRGTRGTKLTNMPT